MGSLTATGCSVIPGFCDQGSGPGSEADPAQPRDVSTRTVTHTDVGTGTELGGLGNLGGLGGNVEACLRVTAVVSIGSTLAFFAKIDPSGESSKKMADQEAESTKKAPLEIKADLENLLKVISI